jgi:hypothetical protein
MGLIGDVTSSRWYMVAGGISTKNAAELTIGWLCRTKTIQGNIITLMRSRQSATTEASSVKEASHRLGL